MQINTARSKDYDPQELKATPSHGADSAKIPIASTSPKTGE